MASQNRKIEIGILIASLIALAIIWAMNGYEDTWLYVSAAILAVPTTWFYFGGKSKGQ